MAGFHRVLWGLTDVFVLHEVDPHIIDKDICHFFEHQLSKLPKDHEGREKWPTDKQLDLLCRRAAGLFVYAVATVNFLNHHFKDPRVKLKLILETPESTAWERGAELKAYENLDTLYKSVLNASFCKNNLEDNDAVRSVLGCMVLATDPLSPSTIATLTGFSRNEVENILELIQSLLVLSSHPNEPVRPFHKSFPDFITDQTRCADEWFFISPNFHIDLFMYCLKLIGESRKNIPTLPDCDLIHKLEDWPEIERGAIPGALEYACRSWHKHLDVIENPTPGVLQALRNFLEEKFGFWLVVLKALGGLRSTHMPMDVTTRWLKKV